ncbi:MAG: methyltransferase domain-containing protein [Acidobacteria bacterium]|nr:methyltransferase domain-containing protein [Acidobacteriota bacterium]
MFFWIGKTIRETMFDSIPATRGEGKGILMPAKESPANRKIDHPRIRSASFRMRQKRGGKIVDLIEKIYAKKQKADIVDVGGTKEYWNIIPVDYLHRRNVHITLVNISPPENLPDKHDAVFSYMQGDGCRLKEIADNQFDLAHSNSVIEHVGNWGKMVDFAGEIRRIAKMYYVQTPNYYFPVEPHFLFPFFHWLPVSIRLRMIMRFQLGCFPKAANEEEARVFVELCRLLTKRKLLYLFPDAALHKEKLFFFVKSFTLIRGDLV